MNPNSLNLFMKKHTRERVVPVISARVSRRILGVADGFAGDEEFHSPVLLPAGGVIVGGDRQTAAEAFGRNRIVSTPLFRTCSQLTILMARNGAFA